jgi:hypothetical protein
LSWDDKIFVDFKIMLCFLAVYLVLTISSIAIFYVYNKKYPKLMAKPEEDLQE